MLLAITSMPTAAGCEGAVQRAIDLWVESLNDQHGVATVSTRRDRVGNVLITASAAARGRARAAGGARGRNRRAASPSLLITAHLDHPAFVVRRALNAHELELEFRGGVHDPYFVGAEIEVFGGASSTHAAPSARITALDAKAQPFKILRATMDDRAVDARTIASGSIARWLLPKAEINGGLLRTHACDDLAALGTAMIVFERLLGAGKADGVGLLFTVAEEVGFLGAIHAASSGIIPRGATLLCLENSRSFPHDSPIGAGAILRVGDRLSVFTPSVTNALTQLYQQHAAQNRAFKWQRKLMPGGACEATAFAALGHASTCLCLPLANYHNMCEIDEVLAGKRPAQIGREFVAIADIESLIDMLMLAAHGLGTRTLGDFEPMMKKLRRERSKLVLGVA